MVAVKKYPYAALGAMIAIASLVIAAVVTVGVAMFTGVFLMYGTMRDIQAKQQTTIEQQVEIKGQISVMKTAVLSTYAKQDFMTALMSKEDQERVNSYDRTHPRYPVQDLPSTGEGKQ